MTRYKELSSRLSDLYGLGSETVEARRWFGREDPNSLLRSTLFRTDEVQVLLFLGSGSGEEGNWNMSYLHLAGDAEFEADKADHSRRDKDAL